MKDVNFIIGSEQICHKPLRPYSEEAIAFLADLSALIMRYPNSRLYPDIVQVGFWCRKANIQKLSEQCPEAIERLGRGLCLHIAPGNIPVNFAFTYFFGLLSGCANIVRLPSRDFPQVAILLECIKNALNKHKEIAKRTAFVRYSSDSDATKQFSDLADARVIWGGDQTINIIRKNPCKPRCVDVCFADRYSICLLNGDTILEASDMEINNLIENFYNDTYLMDQNACSSPQLIYWINDRAEARDRFWIALHKYVEEKYRLQASVAVDKYTKLCEDAIDYINLKNSCNSDNLLYRVELKQLEGDLTQLRGKCGYFYEYSLKDISELLSFITEKYQTITYFGLNARELRDTVIQNNLRGIDRIVPVGKALDIGMIWDGIDLVRVLSRIVNLA